MHPAFIFNLVGTVLLVAALVLHTVSLSTPYYSEADMADLARKVSQLSKTDPRQLGMGNDISPEEAEDIVAKFRSMPGGYINFGMWKICMASQGLSLCVRWSRETTFAHDSVGMVETLEAGGWIRGVQAMAVLGLIFLALGLGTAVLNVVIKSKGDRLRLLYLFILFFCIVAAIFILIGTIIMAAKHRDAFDPLIAQNDQPPPPQLFRLFKERFTLSWGFVLDILSAGLVLLGGIAHFVGGRIANTASGLV